MNLQKLILGTVQFGLTYGINNTTGKPNELQVFEILKYAADNGIKMLDTASDYGNSEQLIGSFIAKNGLLFNLNTKFKGNTISLREQVQTSLYNMNLSHISTYFFHNFVDFKESKQYLDQLEELKANKLISKIGISIYSNEEFAEAIITPQIDVIQFPFNLLDNINQRGALINAAKKNNKLLQVRSVFLQGLFFRGLADFPVNLNELKPYMVKIYEIAHNFNLEIEQLALAYAINQSEIDEVIIGVDSLHQLKRNIRFAEEAPNYKIMDEINKINVKETELLYPKNWK